MKGLLRQVAVLEKHQLIERDRDAPDDRMYRLTWQGRLHALGGRDPQARWSRQWDGCWRLVLFDVPTAQNTHRGRLRRYLRAKGFGYLQKSVWITPDSLEEERQIVGGGKINVESLILLEARPCAGPKRICRFLDGAEGKTRRQGLGSFFGVFTSICSSRN